MLKASLLAALARSLTIDQTARPNVSSHSTALQLTGCVVPLLEDSVGQCNCGFCYSDSQCLSGLCNTISNLCIPTST